MPMLQRGVAALAGKMPKVICPKTHAIIDYVTIAGFFLMGAMFWKRNKRAAVGSMVCGAAEASTALMTDFPGGIAKLISYPTHLKVDMGLAATCSALPNLMGFDSESEAKYFRLMGLNITGVAAMSDPQLQARTRATLRRTA